MKPTSTVLLLIGLAFVSAFAIAGSPGASGDLPHDFQAGTTAKAEEVNENFAYLESRIDDLLDDVSGLQATVLAQDKRIAALEGAFTEDAIALLAEVLPHISVEYLDDGFGNQLKAIRFSEVNVQIVNGAGTTDSINGLGNLIVGYNELGNWSADNRTGSHTIACGSRNSYLSYGGLVLGDGNTVSGGFSSVTGGVAGVASGFHSTVSGGRRNTASATPRKFRSRGADRGSLRRMRGHAPCFVPRRPKGPAGSHPSSTGRGEALPQSADGPTRE